MPRTPKVSSLHFWLSGTVLGGRVVAKVAYAPKKRLTRDVEFLDGSSKRIAKEQLQDLLLIRKGYLPKYAVGSKSRG